MKIAVSTERRNQESRACQSLRVHLKRGFEPRIMRLVGRVIGARRDDVKAVLRVVADHTRHSLIPGSARRHGKRRRVCATRWRYL